MSRGRGRVQRAILAALARQPHQDAVQLAQMVYSRIDPKFVRRHYFSIWRALTGLARENAVVRSPYNSTRGAEAWMLPGPRKVEQAIRTKRENRLRVV